MSDGNSMPARLAETDSSFNYAETIEVQGLRIPFVPQVITPKIERPMRNNRYEKGECEAVRKLLSSGDRVLELGAGVGLISGVAAQVPGVEKVVALEANPELIGLIEETHRINDIANVDIRNGVVCAKSSQAMDFYLRKDFWAASMEPDSRPFTRVVSVPGYGIDELLKEVRPTVIIADIEGAELDLFNNTSLQGVNTVILELHPKVYGEAGQDRVFARFNALGFEVNQDYLKGSVWVLERSADRLQPARAALPDPTHNLEDPTVTIITCMKNEGPFILEWLAFHKSIGISNFVVFSNHCTDGTDLLLDRLDELGEIIHLPNPAVVMQSTYYQPVAIKYARQMPVVRRSDYVISMDVDEFVNIRVGDGHFTDLLRAAGPFHALSMSELNFTSSGHKAYHDVWLTEEYKVHDNPSPGPWKARRGVKTILHGLAAFERPSNHRPLIHPGSENDLVWLDGSGRPAPFEFVTDEKQKSYDCRGAYDLVTLNHHGLRSVDSYLIKMDRGDVVNKNRRVNNKYYRVRMRGGSSENWIAHQLPAARAAEAELLQDTETKRLHKLCVARHKARIAEIADQPDVRELREWIEAKYFSPQTED